jgi:hypothetical protein
VDPTGVLVEAIKRPATERDIYDWMSSQWMWIEFAYIEEVASRPGQGAPGMFKFGMGYGALRMALVACRIPFEAIRPQVWMKRMGCMTHGDKNVSKRKAEGLWPGIKFTHATSDASLIAEAARRTKLRIL